MNKKSEKSDKIEKKVEKTDLKNVSSFKKKKES